MKDKLPDMQTDFSAWYQEVIARAELADHGPTRGSMVIRPYGYAIWELMQQTLDTRFKERGVHNAGFPLLIPESFIQKEKSHVAGFSPELAVVTYAGGKELEEPLVIRPTSETVVHSMFARWITSWRDLPMKVNQWCTVVRWEKRARLFLRTTEIWWQEGHTAHETEQEAQVEAEAMRDVYKAFMENYCAIPVIAAQKPEHEKFAGADCTYTLESLMPDGRALQMGTSHRISQNFARSFDMMFQDRNGNTAYPHLTSWGVTTRMIGAVIMAHGDDKGLRLPPHLAPYQVVIIPIIKGKSGEQVVETAQDIKASLPTAIRTIIDDDEVTTPGAKYYEWEMKGVPLRMEIGPRDIENKQVVLVNRLGDKQTVPFDHIATAVYEQLNAVQAALYDQAYQRRAAMWHYGKKLSEFGPKMAEEGGFYQTGWCGCQEAEAAVREYQGTIRCVLPEQTMETCFVCDSPSTADSIVAKAY